jgi:ribosomal protein L40E
MEWRCEWCGKPHEENDPPCDNCGHGQFERAVVPAGPEGDGGPLVWVCTECGREHPRNNPPCSRCGGMDLEKQRQDDVPVEPIDDGDDGIPSVRDLWVEDDGEPPEGDWETAGEEPTSEGDGQVEAAEAATDTMTTWVCTECGRSHPRNNPPCSRCGSMHLERREERFDDVGARGGGWVDAVDGKVALGFGAVVLLAALVVGPAMGTFDLPGQGPPTVEDVPGESASVGGVDLSAVERSFVDELSAARSERGAGELSWNRELGLFATYQNRWDVKAAYQGGARPSEEGLREAYRSVDSCDSGDIVQEAFDAATVGGTPAEGFDAADAMAAALVDDYLEQPGDVVAASNDAAGVDVHVGPDGRVFVTVAYC